jgi:hypothetical protein
MEFKKEPNDDEVIFMKIEQLSLLFLENSKKGPKGAGVVIKMEKGAVVDKKKCAKIEVSVKKKATIVKKEKLVATVKENIIPAATVNKANQKKCSASIEEGKKKKPIQQQQQQQHGKEANQML